MELDKQGLLLSSKEYFIHVRDMQYNEEYAKSSYLLKTWAPMVKTKTTSIWKIWKDV